jgi:transglutaminase-like putative cysteine protease
MPYLYLYLRKKQMKSRTLIITSLLICSTFLNNAEGRLIPRQRREIRLPAGRTIPQSNIVEFDLSYDFTVSGDTRRISLTAVVPKTIPDRQNIIDIQYSPKPSRIFDQNGNRYAEFIFNKSDKEINIDISVRAELFKYDLVTAKRRRTLNHTSEAGLDDFLKSERYIEKDHQEIRNIAESIEGQTEEEIVKNIYHYVIDHLEYTTHGKGQWGAVKALHEGKGDCSEYSDLFVALCRANNIPARVITGCTVRFDSDSPKHNWVEVYLQDYGWVPFDPSGGDVRSTRVQDIVFSRSAPVYIYFSHIRNDEVLRNYHFASYRYWGDRIKLEDSIEFKLPAQTNSK